MDGDNAREMVHYLVHTYLNDVLGHLQTKEHVQKSVPAMVSVECGQVGGFLIEVYAPEPSLASSLLKQVASLSQ